MTGAAPPPWETRRRIIVRAVSLFAAAITVILAAVLLGRAGVGFFDRNAALIAAIVFLYSPLIAIRLERRDPGDYGFNLGDLRKGGLALLAACAVFFPPFIVGFFLWQKYVAGYAVSPGIPEGFATTVLVQLIVVALPEEAFYRGYLQTRLEEALPGRVRFLGASFGWGMVASSALFALGHVITWGNPLRFNVFFPSLVFGYLRSLTGSIAAGVVWHASCNILVAILLA